MDGGEEDSWVLSDWSYLVGPFRNKGVGGLLPKRPLIGPLVYMKLFVVCSHECNGIKLETAYEQAPKTGFKKNISHGKAESLIMFIFWENHMDFPFKNCHGSSFGRFQGRRVIAV